MNGQEQHSEVFVRFQSFAMNEADGLVYETSADLESGVLCYQSDLPDVRCYEPVVDRVHRKS